MKQQTKQIDDAIVAAQNETLQMQADENGIDLSEFDSILQPIIDSCTKDSISAGKLIPSLFSSTFLRICIFLCATI